MRRYSAGAGRLLTQPIRWNSTTETLLKAPQEPVDPPSLPVEDHVPAGGPMAPRRYRPQPHLDDSSPYTPNIDVLAATAVAGSLSSRLARETLQRAAGQKTEPASSPGFPESIGKLEESSDDASILRRESLLAARRAERLAREMEFSGISQAGTETPTTFASLPNLPSEDPEAAVARRRELLQARRAERLARETAGPPQNRYIPPRSPTRVEASGSTVMSELERRMPLATGGAARDHRTPETSRGGFRGRGGIPETTRGGFRGRGGTPETSRGGFRGRGGTNMRGSKGGGRGARGGAGRGGKRGQRRDREDEDGEEFGDAEIEEWLESDDIEHASALQPEIRAGDLDRVFRSGDQLRGTLKPRAMREIIGGDYSRFTPLNSQHFISAARKLGPARYSSVVLAHSKDLPAGNRSHVQKIVGSVAGSSSKTRRKL